MASEVWREIETITRPVTATINGAERRIVLKTGGVIEGWSAHADEDIARGRKYKILVIDECAMIPNLLELWSAALRPTLVDLQGQALFPSTPKGTNNDFKILWDRTQSDDFPDWQGWHAPSHVNPYLPDGEVEAMRAELPDRLARQEIDAEFVDGADSSAFIAADLWVALTDYDLPSEPNAGTPLILAIDAGVKSDAFALIAVGRGRSDEQMAVRYIRTWKPERGATLNFELIEEEISRFLYAHNVLELHYDPYQLHHMAQRLRTRGFTAVREFSQGTDRLYADTALLGKIMRGGLRHPGNLELNQNILNSDKKIDDRGRLRLIKRSADAKIDLAVTLSMASYAWDKRTNQYGQYSPAIANASSLTGTATLGLAFTPFVGLPPKIGQ